MTFTGRIEVNSRVLLGKPVIRGTRIPVLVLCLLQPAALSRPASAPEPASFSAASGCTGEAYAFALEIRNAVDVRDLDTFFSLVDGELEVGPRKAFVEGKDFSAILPHDWRDQVLQAEPLCASGGWRGYSIGLGNIWFRESEESFAIFALYGLAGSESEPLDYDAWRYGGQILTRTCFETVWMSEDNYEIYRERFDVDWPAFRNTPGRFLGGLVPIEPFKTGWQRTAHYSLAVKLSDCLVSSDSHSVWVEEREGTGEWVVQNSDYCAADYYPHDQCRYHDRYSAVRGIALDHCDTVAPHFAGRCVDLRLVQTVDDTSGTMRESRGYGIFGLVEHPNDGELFILPLVNVWTLNEGLNFVDALEE